MSKHGHSGLSPEEIEKEAFPGESWEEAARRIAQRRARQQAQQLAQAGPKGKAQPAAAKIIRLPFWQDSQRGVP